MNTKKVSCCFGLTIGISMSMLLQTQLNAAMPSISNEFATTSFYSWVYSGYMLASSVTIPLFGSFCERYGYRQNYFIGGILFFWGTLGSALSPNMPMLVLFRVLTGFGAGIVVPATYGIISTLFEKKNMRMVFGFLTVIQIVNKGLGSVIGGYFSTHLNWRYGLLILVPLELVGAGLVFFFSDDNHKMKSDSPIRIRVACYLTSSLLLMMYGLEQMTNKFTMLNLVILLIGIISIVLIIVLEKKSEGSNTKRNH